MPTTISSDASVRDTCVVDSASGLPGGSGSPRGSLVTESACCGWYELIPYQRIAYQLFCMGKQCQNGQFWYVSGNQSSTKKRDERRARGRGGAPGLRQGLLGVDGFARV